MYRNKFLKKMTSWVLAVVTTIAFWAYVPRNTVYAQSRTGSFSKSYSLGNNPGQTMVNIAFAQEGRKGSQMGYTEDWCADFVSDCAVLAGQSGVIPHNANVRNLANAIKGTVTSTPTIGDICIFDWNSVSGPYDHVEIVYKVSGNTVYTIGGNAGSTGSYKTNYVKTRNATATGQVQCYIHPYYSGSANPPVNDDELGIGYPRPSGNPLLSTGSKGSGVSWLQTALNKANNAGLAVDGDFGSGTKQAVVNFQKANGLEADGIAGPATINKLVEVINGCINSILDAPTWATLSTQNNRTVFGVGEQVQFKMNSDNAKYYVIGIDYEGNRIVTSPTAEGYDLYCYGFNTTGNYTAYVSAYNGNNHIESNVVNFKVVENVNSPTWATLTTQDNRTVFEVGEQVQFKMNSDNAKYYVIGIDYERERIVTSPMAEGYDLYCYGFNFTGNYTAYVSAYNGNNHIESNVVNFKVTHSYGSWKTTKSATCTSEGQETIICSACGEKETRSISKVNHKYTSKVVAPTYTQEGYTIHTCSECGDSYKDNFTEKLVKLSGDINSDGKLSVTDTVILQKWLLDVPDTKLTNWKTADLNNDGILNVFDLCLMKRRLIK